MPHKRRERISGYELPDAVVGRLQGVVGHLDITNIKGTHATIQSHNRSRKDRLPLGISYSCIRATSPTDDKLPNLGAKTVHLTNP